MNVVFIVRNGRQAMTLLLLNSSHSSIIGRGERPRAMEWLKMRHGGQLTLPAQGEKFVRHLDHRRVWAALGLFYGQSIKLIGFNEYCTRGICRRHGGALGLEESDHDVVGLPDTQRTL
jgi:hypothetical protein